MARPQPLAVPSTAPAARSPAPAPAAPITIHLVCTDDALWGELSARLPQLRWSQHDSIADLIGEIEPAASAIALIDGREGADLAGDAQTLLAHAPGVVPVVLTAPGHEDAARRLVRSQLFYELIPAGLDARAMGERLERAAEEAHARAALHQPTPVPAEAPRVPPTEDPAAGGRSPPPAFVVAGAATLALALIALGVTYWSRTRPPVAVVAPPAQTAPAVAAAAPLAAPASTPRAPVADTQAELDAELTAARAALRDKRYIEPENDSALSHYQAAVALAPGSDEARQGLARVNEVLIGRAQAALAAHDYPTALRAVETARTLFANDPGLVAIDQELARERKELTLAQIQAAIAADNFERANALLTDAQQHHLIAAGALAQAREELKRRQGNQELASLVRLATERLDQGQLVSPAKDSVKYYLGEAERRSSAEQSRAVRRLAEEYQQALATQWATAAARHDATATAGWLRELQASGASPQRVAELTGTAPAPRGARADALPAPPSATAEPAPASPPPPAAQPPAIVASLPAASGATDSPRAPRLVGGLDPTYPSSALRRRVSGWVEIEVSVAASGKLTDARVVGSAPPSVFDSAARAAVRHARFQAAQAADGSAVAGVGVVRVRFELPEDR